MEILANLEEINRKTKDAIEVIYGQTNTTNQSAVKIREATEIITSIAEETNLLLPSKQQEQENRGGASQWWHLRYKNWRNSPMNRQNK